MKTYHWGIIGCGNVTEVKSGPAYQKVDGFQLQAVMRRDAEKAADYAKRHQVLKSYSNADLLISDPEIDAVYIATPPNTHAYYALKVAEAGKICCIEKPMAPTYAECVTILKAFEEKNTPLFVAYYRRSLPRFEKIKQWLKEEKIGEVRTIHWNLSKYASEQDKSKEYNWRTDSEIAPGGYFDDLASHGMDLFMYLLGDILQAQGFSVNQQNLYTAKDAVVGSWIHESGVTGTGNWNFGLQQRIDEVIIRGNKGEIRFPVFEEAEIILQTAEEKVAVFIENPVNIQQFHVENMKQHLQGLKKHPSTGKTAAKTSWVLEQLLGK